MLTFHVNLWPGVPPDPRALSARDGSSPESRSQGHGRPDAPDPPASGPRRARWRANRSVSLVQTFTQTAVTSGLAKRNQTNGSLTAPRAPIPLPQPRRNKVPQCRFEKEAEGVEGTGRGPKGQTAVVAAQGQVTGSGRGTGDRAQAQGDAGRLRRHSCGSRPATLHRRHHHLRARSDMISSPQSVPKAYVVRAGSDGQDEEFALANDVVVVGWNAVASLEDADSREAVRELLEEAYHPRPVRRSHPGQLWRFCGEIREGDIVVLPRNSPRPVAIGRVVGPYRYRARITQVHTRPVEWLHTDIPRTAFPDDLLASLNAPQTVYGIGAPNAVQRIRDILARYDGDAA